MTMLRFQYSLIALMCVALCVSNLASAKDWPRFRGADGSGVADEKNLLEQWGPDGPKLVWEAKGAGIGYASVAISAGRAYTMGDGPSTATDKDEYLTCYDDKDGRQIWKTKVGVPHIDGTPARSGSQGTPSVDGDRVYALSPKGILVCCQTSDGKLLWKKDYKADFGGKNGDSWAYGESPLVDGDRIICTPGGTTSTVVALNKMTGELVWTCVRPGDPGAGHSSAMISEVGGKRIYVQNTSIGAIGIEAATGKLLWENPVEKPTAFNPSPIVKGDLVYSIAGYGQGGATLIRQVPGPDGSISAQIIYPVNKSMKNRHGGVVLVGEFIYGGTDHSNTLFCANMLTGEHKWETTSTGNPSQRGSSEPNNIDSVSTIAAGDKLIQRYESGMVTLVKADPSKYVEISKFMTPSAKSGANFRKGWANPSIANGKLYIRQDDSIYCYNISK